MLLSRLELPQAPQDKIGWPWTEESKPLPQFFPDGRSWPKISIVTPSYNQGEYLEETIRSVLLQNYPNLEYIIIDGGSSDNSVDIIRKYDPWITYWISEKDKGQAHAINKGLAHCSGEIFNWLNSDDLLAPNALRIIAERFRDYDLLSGAVVNFSITDRKLIKTDYLSAKAMIMGDPRVIYQQPGAWLRTNKVRALGGLDERLHCCFDWFLMIYYVSEYPNILYLEDVLANFRVHANSKTVIAKDVFFLERVIISAFLIRDPNMKGRYGDDARVYLQNALRVYRIHNIMAAQISRTNKLLAILAELARDIFSYPYRYALGAIKKIISGAKW